MQPSSKTVDFQKPMPGNRCQVLDILRAVAIFLVMFQHLPAYSGTHATLSTVVSFLRRGGWVGVDLFFVLSGFLIAGLLFKEQSQTGSISFVRFFIRRGFKIYPAYYLMTTITMFILVRPGYQATLFKEAVPSLFYLQDYIYNRHTPIGAFWIHTWSLAVEEKFYLLLPPLLIFLTIISKSKSNPFKSIPFIFLFIASGCLVTRLFLAKNVLYNGMLHSAPFHIRMDSLFFGVFISYIYHYHPVALRTMAKRAKNVLLGFGMALLLPAFLFKIEETPFIYSMGYTLFYLGGGLILIAVLEGAPNECFLSRITAYIGARSYSIYLWHIPISGILWVPEFGWGWASVCYWIGAIIFGIAMSNFVELPLLRLRDRHYPSRSASAKIQPPTI